MEFKKSQITIFIILGIIILAVISFLFKVAHTVSTEDIEERATIIYKDFLYKTALKDYIQACLDNAAKEGLILAGLGGGNIYNNQLSGTGGAWDEPGRVYLPFDFRLYNKDYSINVSYALTKPTIFSSGTYHSGPPDYPYSGSLVENHKLSDRFNLPLDNAFGLTFSNDNVIDPHPILTPLCDLYGLNWYEMPGAENSCKVFDLKASPSSIQTDLTKYIANKTRECVNFSYFIEKGYNITYGGIKSDVLIGENDIVFAINYSLNVSLYGSTPITRYDIFNSKQDVKLKKIYELAHHMAIEDAKNIFFNMTNINDLIVFLDNSCSGFIGGKRLKDKLPCFDETIFTNVSIFRNVCSDCIVGSYSDVIRIEDNTSLINGHPYVFQFAVQNRIPALDLIDESVDSNFDYWSYMNDNFGKTPIQAYGIGDPDYNIQANRGDTLEIYPRAIDPDEDNVTYLIQNDGYCCEAAWGDNKFTINTDGFPEGEHTFNLYACDDEGLETCLVEVAFCPTPSLSCADENRCNQCDYQEIKLKIT